ncbi:hypothetical protein [Streptomyces sp. NPDC088775]|uniref:hypothetical protein n=1 Tax=Streptomyces sp. NPDC088775 TaxID=3365896 RepID=UPI00380E96E4
MTGPQQSKIRLPEDEFNCRRIPDWSMRQPGTQPRWVATYEADWTQGGKRLVGLLVPRPCKHNMNAVSHLVHTNNGEIVERHVGVNYRGEVTGTWFTARASELPREQWTAIRAFYKNLPPPHNGDC